MWKTGIRRVIVVAGATALGCLIGGCTETDPCDENEMLSDGWCVPAAVDAAIPIPVPDASGVGDEVNESEAGGSGDEVGAPTAFGQVCMTAAECVAPTNYCALVPGQASGNCTSTGCNLDPSICPAGWTCMDLTVFVGEHLCVPPGI